MPRRKRKRTSVRAYFRKAFTEHPDWLRLSDNTEVLKQWSADHDGKAPDDKVKQSMAACKSAMRVDQGIATRGPHKGRRKKIVAAVPARAILPDVEKLETMIYEADSYARTLEVGKLEPVVRHLRRALAHIVLAFDEEA